MAYCKRPDGKIALSIDSNAWNKLLDAKVALATELPSDRFKLFLPREIEIETHSIPNAADKIQLRDYIAQQVHEAEIVTTYTFGFANISGERRGVEALGGEHSGLTKKGRTTMPSENGISLESPDAVVAST